MIKRAEHQLGKAGQLWKSEGRELTHQIRQIFPLTTVVADPSFATAAPTEK
jgi:hypothetical protein